jgi:hypothetical protein
LFTKIKDNLAIVVTAITLLGSIGAGIQSLGAVLTTLSNIDDRMYQIEEQFDQLRSERIKSDIDVLNSQMWEVEDVRARLGYVEANTHNH